MHRGSSKGTGGTLPGPETLPLSASPSSVNVRVEFARGERREPRRVRVVPGTTVRELLRRLGEHPEGSAVLIGDVSVPLDTPIERSLRLTVVPTFSGG